MKIFTIGFTKKSAKVFFETLKNNNVKKVIDIRLNNKSQLAGFAKGDDLEYFLKAIGDIDYSHNLEYAPTHVLLKRIQTKEIRWEEYENAYINLLEERNNLEEIDIKEFDNCCFLCSEAKSEKCHRRLLTEQLKKYYRGIEIIHL